MSEAMFPIAPKFRLGGDLKVQGGVWAAQVQVGRHFIVGQGISSDSKVTVGGSTKALFIERSIVHSRIDIIVQDSTMRAELFAGRNVLLSDGAIVGGTACAGEKILAHRVGSSSDVETNLSVGIHPKIRRRRRDLQMLLNRLEEGVDRLAKDIIFLEQTDPTSLPPKSRQRYQQLPQMKARKTRYENELDQARRKLVQLLNLAKVRWPPDPHIEVRDTVFQGVRVEVGWDLFPVTTEFHRVIFKMQNKTICLVDLA
ncbi:hypothetical protein CMK12_02700 [Candidatus Poribacteria bacterium]|nr:hypothetical protein [Candidatus Poribacteria bacterium]